ncbi:MAG: LacI family DNA-binding transcriptional regulator, partial [Alphaproteobacteria bacterium]
MRTHKRLAATSTRGADSGTGSGPARIRNDVAATIKDVARVACVSVSTVSHVVNRTRPVAADTASRVEQAVNDLGYRPSGVARALKGNRMRTVGMLVTSSTNPFFAEVIRGVEERCFDRGYSLILCNTGDVEPRLSSYLSTLLSKSIDGLVVMTTNVSRDFLARLDIRHGLPVIAIDTSHIDGVSVVNDDSVSGGRMAGDFLIGRGFRRIAILAGPKEHPRSAERLQGVREAAAAWGLDLDFQVVEAAELTLSGGYCAMNDLLERKQRTERCEAVFCINDLIAAGALCALAERGLSVPDDISVMGYDDIELAAFTVPPLTTIRQPASGIGRRAADMLIDRLQTGDTQTQDERLPPMLIQRKSVGWAVGRECQAA